MDKKQVTISVIIPVYNVEKYLVDCLESVVNQTVPFEQIIIINDGSTDNSLSICEQYQNKYNNVFLYSQENQGLAAARNKGMKFVTSDYIIFLDSDDYLAVNTVERLQCQLSREDLDIVYYDTDILVEYTSEEGKFTGQSFTNHYDRVGKIEPVTMQGKEYFFSHYPTLFPVSACMACFKVVMLREKQIIFPLIRSHEDQLFSIVAVLEASAVRYIPERFYMRRYRENSITTTELDAKRMVDFWQVFELQWNYYVGRKETWTVEESEFLRYSMWQSYVASKGWMQHVILDTSAKEALKRYQAAFCKSWMTMCGNKNASLLFCKKCIGFCRGWNEQETEVFNEIYVFLTTEYKKRLKEMLMKLPLSKKNSKVGIYGTGYHTQQLLCWYAYLCGEVQCELIFIDTYKASGVGEYWSQPIMNIADVEGSVEYIVISSVEYEMQMKEQVKTLYGDSIPLICFYETDKENIFLDYERFIEK